MDEFNIQKPKAGKHRTNDSVQWLEKQYANYEVVGETLLSSLFLYYYFPREGWVYKRPIGPQSGNG